MMPCACFALLYTGMLYFPLLVGSKTLKSLTSCYGDTHDDFVRPSCADGFVIEISEIYVLAKETSTGCPNEATTLNRDYDRCCTVSTTDCKMIYVGDGMPYHTKCSGYSSCVVPVAWAPTTCSGEEYLRWSNYMLFEFYCVNGSESTVSVEANTTTSDTVVYLQNENYPTVMSSKGKYTCSLVASCNTKVVVKAIHLSLYSDMDGECHQFFTFYDDGELTKVDCMANTGNGNVSLLISSSYYLTLEFVNEYAEENGSFWIEIEGYNKGSQVELSCNDLFRDRPEAVPQCNYGVPESSALEGRIIAAIVGSIFGLAVIGIAVGFGICKWHNHSNKTSVQPITLYPQPPASTLEAWKTNT